MERNATEELRKCSDHERFHFKDILIDVATDVCGKTGTKRQHVRETWWWNEEVQKVIKEKRTAFKTWQRSRAEDDLKMYRSKNKIAKRVVATARSKQCEVWLSKPKGEQLKEIFRLAKTTTLSKRDVTGSTCIKARDGTILTSDIDINNRWQTYFDELLNETNPINADFQAEPVEGPIRLIDGHEIENAIKSMKKGKAPGPSCLSTYIIAASGKLVLNISRKYHKNFGKPEFYLDNGSQVSRCLYTKGKEMR